MQWQQGRVAGLPNLQHSELIRGKDRTYIYIYVHTYVEIGNVGHRSQRLSVPRGYNSTCKHADNLIRGSDTYVRLREPRYGWTKVCSPASVAWSQPEAEPKCWCWC